MYAYRASSIDQPDNAALRAAFALQVPIVYFVGTRPGFYRALYTWYIESDLPDEQRVWVSAGKRVGPLDELEPIPIDDPIERRYAVRTVRVRLHQDRFRWRVVPAYGRRCAICRLREVSLLDAAHIIEDSDPRGEPEISNGVSLCSIHHRAFDNDLVASHPTTRFTCRGDCSTMRMGRCSMCSRQRRA
jgi:putative restriction endonuclease